MAQPLSSKGDRSPWFVSTNSPQSGLRLFCFPFAGGGASTYSQWRRCLPPDVEPVAVELPGRGGRLREPAFRGLRPVVRAIADAIRPYLDKEYAFFGHSMGALIAFELVRELRRRNERQPNRLFVSGRSAPQIPDQDPLTYALPEAEFKAELRRLNGTPAEVLEHDELMQLMLPLLRADFELIQTYEYRDEAQLDCPITAYGGLQDVEVPREVLYRWKEQTKGDFALHMLPGDHFFLRPAQRALLALITQDLLTTNRRAEI